MKLSFPPRTLVAVALATALAACSIPAKLDRPTLRDEAPLAGLQTANRPGWPAADWWRVYNDPQLDQLIELALRSSPDLAQAKSRVDSAQQNIRVAASQAGLRIDGSAQVARQRMSENGLIPSKFLGFTWYNQSDLGIQVQYDFDWWGKKRGAIEGAIDQARAAEAQRSAASLAIQSSVADTYFGWLADEARVGLADELVAARERALRIAELRVRQGVDVPDTVQQAQAELAGARQQRVALQGSANIRHAALATLAGVAPADLPDLQPRALPDVAPGLPANVGVDLIARRPDIAASRWQIEAALKQTDVARAQYFPDVSLTAMAGLSSIDMDKVFSASSRTFGLTPAIHLPIFEGGALEANYGVSKAQLDAAVAQYNATVVAAARDVATQALGAEQIAARREQQAHQVGAVRTLLSSAKARAVQGVRDDREQLATQAQLLDQRDADVELHGQALSTDVSLIKSLGGGYRNDANLPSSTNRTNGATTP
ncbi:NodT family efflux transporter outer membrane factor (OMF) lipoprotein [Luteibacter rhizovicinus]|uniref:NodT family efflux transporter outer membrane factor (OMF) lipoprotein n=1 Tax=Luteibacter rhizovicinus TaxID=242606 RepID=A0A4R3YY25_9GAMM|nr:efflux transporter outer membrane subunit [Luteibacter rhizovicinus]TCV97550.1 NodT family efflux transporter outer membrane factor (OMF) lipoprotein [Luteibacter rhizovicinus]